MLTLTAVPNVYIPKILFLLREITTCLYKCHDNLMRQISTRYPDELEVLLMVVPQD